MPRLNRVRTIITILAAACMPLQPAAAKRDINQAEFAKAVECASLFGFIGGQVPSGSPASAEISNRRSAWVAYATQSNGGNASAAQQAAINATIALRGKLAVFAGDEDKITEALRPLNARCQPTSLASVPASQAAVATIPATMPAAKPAAPITDRDRKGGELATRCAGMARLHADIDNFIAIDLYGTEAVYQKILAHFRPDVSAKDREAQIQIAMRDHAKVISTDTQTRRASIAAGQGFPSDDTMQATVRGKECARMVNTLRAVKIID